MNITKYNASNNYNGLPTNLFDKNDKEICVGDKVRLLIMHKDKITEERIFKVKYETVIREFVPPKGFISKGKNLLAITGIVFEWDGNLLLPSVIDGISVSQLYLNFKHI